jgi:hypothetical protein
MRHADLYTGGGKMRDALKSLRAAWQQADVHWRDVVRDDFEHNYFEPIELQALGVIEAVGHLAEVLARAEHECC